MSEKLSKDELVDIKNQLLMSKKLNEDMLEPQMTEAMSRYNGTFIPSIGTNWDVILNEIYPIIQYNLPSTFFRNPRVFLKPRNKTFIAKRRNPNTGAMEELTLDAAKSAKTQEAILNYCMGEIGYKEEVRKVLLDALLFRHGVLWHGYKGNFGMTEERSFLIKDENVFVKRLNPMRFFKDPTVNMSNLDEARWVARSFDYPLRDLLEDDRLDVDKKAVKGKVGFGDSVVSGEIKAYGNDVIMPNMKALIDYADKDYKNQMGARFVEVFEVFMRPTPKEKREGGKGKVVLYTFEQPNQPLRVSKWPYKAEGWPARILQFNALNDAQFGLADIDTYKSDADQKNAIVNLQLRNAQENSKVWVGISKEGANEEDIDMVKQGDQTIIRFEGGKPSERMYVASPGGSASNELFLIDGRIDKSLQDKSGVSDLKRGFLQSGEESAASVKIRNAGGSARPSYRQDIMAEMLKGSTHYLNQLLKQYFPIDKAVRIVGSLDLEWSQNPSEEEVQADTDVEIDVISMLPEDPEKEIQQLNTVLTLMIQGLTDPTIKQKLAEEGKTIELSPIIEQLLTRLKIRNPGVFRNIKPEESQGYVSVSEIRAAKDNINAALSGQPQVPSPPAMGQDHVARLEMYTEIANIIGSLGETDTLKLLNELIAIHEALLQEEQKQASEPGIRLKAPSHMALGGK